MKHILFWSPIWSSDLPLLAATGLWRSWPRGLREGGILYVPEWVDSSHLEPLTCGLIERGCFYFCLWETWRLPLKDWTCRYYYHQILALIKTSIPLLELIEAAAQQVMESCACLTKVSFIIHSVTIRCFGSLNMLKQQGFIISPGCFSLGFASSYNCIILSDIVFYTVRFLRGSKPKPPPPPPLRLPSSLNWAGGCRVAAAAAVAVRALPCAAKHICAANVILVLSWAGGQWWF